MHVTERVAGDRQRLQERIAKELNAKQRDRLRAVALALDGQETLAIARMLGRSRRFVQDWVYVYRDQGLEAVRATPQRGRPATLPPAYHEAFTVRMLQGATAVDKDLCVLRGQEAQRILEQEFGRTYSLSGAYKFLHRLGFSCLRPRPRHRKNDPEAMAQWRADAPLLSSKSARGTRTGRSKCGSRTKPGSASKAP